MQTNLPNNGFSAALHQRADAYFQTQRYGRFATAPALAKCVLLVAMYAAAYVYFLTTTHSFASLLTCAALLGLFHVLLPVNIAHDAIHGSLSATAQVNRVGLLAMELTGANSFIYRKKHLQSHRDKERGSTADAAAAQGLLLQSEKENRTVNLPYAAYALYAEYMIFVRDFKLFRAEADAVPAAEWRKLYVSKTLYAVAFLVLPFACIQRPFWQIVLALSLMYAVVTVLLVVILLMPTEKTATAKGSGADDAWAGEILAQNVDFSPGSVLLNQAVGGANLNVVHYLFPAVHHTHYNHLAKLVEQTALEHDWTYRKQNVRDVFGIHFSYLRNIAAPTAGKPLNASR